MSRGVKLGLFICFICIIGTAFSIYYIAKKANLNFDFSFESSEDKKLYQVAADFIQNQDYLELYQSEDKDLPYAHVFVKYDGLGVEEKNGKKIVYLWVVSQVHYVKNKQLKSASGYSMFKKVTIKNGVVKKVESPEDGGNYTSSIKKLVTNSKIRKKVLNYNNTMSTEEDALKYYKEKGIL